MPESQPDRSDPVGFLQQLAQQSQLLACLQWLGEFQVLACIPLHSSALFADVALFASVPEEQLCRVARMTASVGFLAEPQPGHIAHSNMSAQFVLQPALLDAMMFLSATMMPTALQMPLVTRLHGHSQLAHKSAYNAVSQSRDPFTVACEQQPKLQRQYIAYHRLVTDSTDENLIDILSRLDWHTLGEATVVEACALSTTVAAALAKLHPNLRVVVQMCDSRRQGQDESSFATKGLITGPGHRSMPCELQADGSGRVTIQQRSPGMPQTVEGAAVYILRSPSPLISPIAHSPASQLTGELRAHLGVLRNSTSATLIVVTRVILKKGAVDPDVEAIARLRDMSLFQLGNQRDLEISELVDIISSVRDDVGRLVPGSTIISSRNPTVAIEVRYKPNADLPDR